MVMAGTLAPMVRHQPAPLGRGKEGHPARLPHSDIREWAERPGEILNKLLTLPFPQIYLHNWDPLCGGPIRAAVQATPVLCLALSWTWGLPPGYERDAAQLKDTYFLNFRRHIEGVGVTIESGVGSNAVFPRPQVAVKTGSWATLR